VEALDFHILGDNYIGEVCDDASRLIAYPPYGFGDGIARSRIYRSGQRLPPIESIVGHPDCDAATIAQSVGDAFGILGIDDVRIEAVVLHCFCPPGKAVYTLRTMVPLIPLKRVESPPMRDQTV
jgi:hypothetical protein